MFPNNLSYYYHDDAKLLFSTLFNPKNVLNQLLPPLCPPSSHQLWPRAHNLILPPKDTVLYCIYSFI